MLFVQAPSRNPRIGANDRIPNMAPARPQQNTAHSYSHSAWIW